MPTVSFSYTITASLTAPATDFGYAIRIPDSTGRQLLKREHYAIQGSGSSAEKRDPLGNRILTGISHGTSARLAVTVSGKAYIDPGRPDDDGLALFADVTDRTRAGGLLRVFYLRHSAVGDAVDRARHFALKLREGFVCRAGLSSHVCAEEALESKRGSPEDLAHILLALCRLDDISARYVTGLTAYGPSAWIEVWNGWHWVPLDPLAGELCGPQYLKIAHGRDGGDVTLAAVSKGCAISRTEIHSTLSADHSRTH